MNKGLELEVLVEETRFPNTGIVYKDGHEIRIKGALKGEKLLIRISRKRKDYFQAKIVEILEKSELESQESCPHFGICGGCSYQTMTYEDELKYKEEQVRNLLEASGLDLGIKGIIGSPSSQGYRNKMDYSFGDEYKDGPLSLGMHRKGRFYEIEAVEHCNIADKDFSRILMASLDYFRGIDASFYNRKRHEGLLRNLLVRKSLTRGDIMVNLVTSSQGQVDMDEFSRILLDLELEGEITGILHTLNDNVADIVKVDRLDLIYGRDYIMEEICGLKFKISPFSFFQTNTFAAEKLYNVTRDIIGDIEGKKVFDLYSGTGTIAQIMAQKADEVVAIELIEEAVEMAKENAELNEIDNIEFIAGDMFKVIDGVELRPDVIVIDPPRPGLENTLDKILNFQADRIIYVSCNPTTMVRDLKGFQEAGYKIDDLQLLDQFPRTPHVEAIVKLENHGI